MHGRSRKADQPIRRERTNQRVPLRFRTKKPLQTNPGLFSTSVRNRRQQPSPPAPAIAPVRKATILYLPEPPQKCPKTPAERKRRKKPCRSRADANSSRPEHGRFAIGRSVNGSTGSGCRPEGQPESRPTENAIRSSRSRKRPCRSAGGCFRRFGCSDRSRSQAMLPPWPGELPRIESGVPKGIVR